MKLFGIMITYRRRDELVAYLNYLSRVEPVFHYLLVVDNDHDCEIRRIVESCAASTHTEYMEMADNVGPAGGIAAGMRLVLSMAEPEDWIVLLDDDDPPWSHDVFGTLRDFTVDMVRQEPRTAGVGITGGTWDNWRTRLRAPTWFAGAPGLPVDYLGGDGFPFYSVASIRDVGVFDDQLFFGLDDLEMGLRLRQRNWLLFLHGPLARERLRLSSNRASGAAVYSSEVPPPWRRYYGVRNLIHIARRYLGTAAALRVTLLYGLASPLVGILRREQRSSARFRLTMLACWDGWRGRLGRRVEPVPKPRPQSLEGTS